MDLAKIISGGQTGVDQGALAAAKELNLETGGWIPKGFLTEDGPMPWLGSSFNLISHSSTLYPPRTAQNVKDSDATIWLGPADSRGFRCTLKAIQSQLKSYRVLSFDERSSQELRIFLVINPIRVLNVAGSRESKCRGIQRETREFLIRTLRIIV